eukprot:TRINITY_DN1128_c0_g1_i1.p1 TRINITY_DN1128_c0_g1~~TRINITY_DN1128_c0_g1_i1.p1  ORF type:complete len:128 (-),score=24.32 TRINITY_DN1128_c0_g1_i1:79-462(-)
MLSRLLSNRAIFRVTQARKFSLSLPATSDAFGKREKGLEEQNVRKHEAEMLKKLQEELKLKDEQLRRAEAKDSGLPERRDTRGGLDGRYNPNDSHDVYDLVMDIRKELMTRIRSLEDEIEELKYSRR